MRKAREGQQVRRWWRGGDCLLVRQFKTEFIVWRVVKETSQNPLVRNITFAWKEVMFVKVNETKTEASDAQQTCFI